MKSESFSRKCIWFLQIQIDRKYVLVKKGLTVFNGQILPTKLLSGQMNSTFILRVWFFVSHISWSLTQCRFSYLATLISTQLKISIFLTLILFVFPLHHKPVLSASMLYYY